mmetsp:Transcript_33055/g.87733  ORF Transcript_33055/g.87733 Transcript_33055/m.87733 type:complete len:353 (+) Transcript_33055:981-2039(+)
MINAEAHGLMYSCKILVTGTQFPSVSSSIVRKDREQVPKYLYIVSRLSSSMLKSSMYTLIVWLRTNPTNSMMMDSNTIDQVPTDTLACIDNTIKFRESANCTDLARRNKRTVLASRVNRKTSGGIGRCSDRRTPDCSNSQPTTTAESSQFQATLTNSSRYAAILRTTSTVNATPNTSSHTLSTSTACGHVALADCPCLIGRFPRSPVSQPKYCASAAITAADSKIMHANTSSKASLSTSLRRRPRVSVPVLTIVFPLFLVIEFMDCFSSIPSWVPDLALPTDAFEPLLLNWSLLFRRFPRLGAPLVCCRGSSSLATGSWPFSALPASASVKYGCTSLPLAISRGGACACPFV